MIDDAQGAGPAPPLHLSGTDLLRLERALQALFNTDKLDSLGMYALSKNLDQFSNADASRQEAAKDLVRTAQEDERLRELLTMAKELAADLKTQRSNALIALSDELLAKPPPPLGAVPGTGRTPAGFPSWAKWLVGAVLAIGALLTVARITDAWPFDAQSTVTPQPTVAQAPEGIQGAATIRAGGAPLLREAVIEDAILLRDYCNDRDLPCGDFTRDQLNTMGSLVVYTITTDNYECEPCTVVWSLHDAETDMRIPDPKWYDRPAWPDGSFTSESSSDQGRGEIWVERPAEGGSYFIRVELRNTGGVPVDFKDTAEFTV